MDKQLIGSKCPCSVFSHSTIKVVLLSFHPSIGCKHTKDGKHQNNCSMGSIQSKDTRMKWRGDEEEFCASCLPELCT